jgi:hypothetical protein
VDTSIWSIAGENPGHAGALTPGLFLRRGVSGNLKRRDRPPGVAILRAK